MANPNSPGPTDNKHDGVFAGETRTITHPSIEAIGNNKVHPHDDNVTATSFVLGAGHPAPHGN